jgi:hypothetical protein
MRLAVAVLAAFVLAGPAAALTDPSAYTGTLAGKGVGKAQGLPKQKQKVSVPGTILTLHPDTGRFDFAVGAASLGGPMSPAKKGAFKIVQPTGADLTALIAGTQTFFTDNLGLPVTVTGVQASGRHRPNRTGSKDRSNIVLNVTGTALGVVPFQAKATLHFAGPLSN